MIRITVYQNQNDKSQAFQKWYPRVVAEETIGLDKLAEHMSNHNTPFSAGAIKGILTDAVSCTKELLLLGKNVKFPDLAIFSIGYHYYITKDGVIYPCRHTHHSPEAIHGKTSPESLHRLSRSRNPRS